jgi:hypothetical protein
MNASIFRRRFVTLLIALLIAPALARADIGDPGDPGSGTTIPLFKCSVARRLLDKRTLLYSMDKSKNANINRQIASFHTAATKIASANAKTVLRLQTQLVKSGYQFGKKLKVAWADLQPQVDAIDPNDDGAVEGFADAYAEIVLGPRPDDFTPITPLIERNQQIWDGELVNFIIECKSKIAAIHSVEDKINGLVTDPAVIYQDSHYPFSRRAAPLLLQQAHLSGETLALSHIITSLQHELAPNAVATVACRP